MNWYVKDKEVTVWLHCATIDQNGTASETTAYLPSQVEKILNVSKRFKPAEKDHPGFLVFDEIEARHLSPSFVADGLGLSIPELSDLTLGKSSVDSVLATKLEQVFEIKVDYWLRLQEQFDEKDD